MVAVGTEQSACPRDVVAFQGFPACWSQKVSQDWWSERPLATASHAGRRWLSCKTWSVHRVKNNDQYPIVRHARTGAAVSSLPVCLWSRLQPLNGLDWKPPTNIPHDAANPDASHEPPVPADDKIHTRKIKRPRDFGWESITREACAAELLQSALVSLDVAMFSQACKRRQTARQQTTHGSIRRPRDKGLT